MYTITEVWTPRPAFEALSTEAEEQFFGTLGDAVVTLETSGVHCQGWGRVRRFDEHSVDHTWMAVWTAPDEATAAAFLRCVAESGW
jgi:phosphoribosylaminoimidazole (AIR) synthetase